MSEPIIEEVIDDRTQGLSTIEPVVVYSTDPNIIDTYTRENPHDVLIFVNQQDLTNNNAFSDIASENNDFCDVIVDKDVDLRRGIVRIKRSTYIKKDGFTSVKKYEYKRLINPEKDRADIERAELGKPIIPKILHSEDNSSYKIEYPDDYDYKNDKEYHFVYEETGNTGTFEDNEAEYVSDCDSDEVSDDVDLMDVEDPIEDTFDNMLGNNSFFTQSDMNDFDDEFFDDDSYKYF
ncbi:hypothetical protein FOG50_00512 [Hanseniaspora uvarum]|nr:hypothetical protein FOG50_00512 [Hanseniaspora uvarum]